MAIFCGNDEIYTVELFKSINKSIYMCDKVFHTDHLYSLLDDDNMYGYVIVDGSGYLLGTLNGESKSIINKTTVELPKKHGRGGQSAVRFGRLRVEARHNYIRKVAEHTNLIFLNYLQKYKQFGIVIAGSAELKQVLFESDILDKRIKECVVCVVDIASGMEGGFSQAIELSQKTLKNSKYLREQKIIDEFMDEIKVDGSYCFDEKDVDSAIENGAVKTLILWNESELIEKYRTHPNKAGFELKLVSNCTSISDQFIKGFKGMGAVLRYKIVFEHEFTSGTENNLEFDDVFN